MKEYTTDEIRAYLTRQYGNDAATVITQVNRWLARGDGIAVYENQDLGHHDLGSCRLMSYGSPHAQLETDVPPSTMPDIGNEIGWRYLLAGTYRTLGSGSL
jgi:hypothetical protein